MTQMMPSIAAKALNLSSGTYAASADRSPIHFVSSGLRSVSSTSSRIEPS
jgi:hypothetical protein